MRVIAQGPPGLECAVIFSKSAACRPCTWPRSQVGPCTLTPRQSSSRCTLTGLTRLRYGCVTQASFSDGSDDYGSKSEPATKVVRRKQPSTQNIGYSGVFWLLLINFALFLADHTFHLPWVSNLYLIHSHPRWWQYVTSAFCHGSWEHISSNAFMLLIFGRIVEEEEGTFGVWTTYILCALGASIASVIMQPSNVVSLGASGAVFGLFTVSVLCKLSFNFRKLLEGAILGQFVLKQVIQEANMQSRVWAGGQGLTIAGSQVGHLAHLAGALAGVCLVLVLSKLPAVESA